jgi:hypothetical protein
MKIKCSSRKPVAMGSIIQVSRNFQMPLRRVLSPPTQRGACSASSFLEASSICCSPVLPSSDSSFSLSDTKAAGERAARQRVPPLTGGGGVLKNWRAFWKNRGRLYVLAVNVKERPAVDVKERADWELKKGRAFDCLWQACFAQVRPKSSGALMLFLARAAIESSKNPCLFSSGQCHDGRYRVQV